MVGVIQIAILLALIGPLQRWRPVEPVTDRATIRTDVLYTLIHRLGLFRMSCGVLPNSRTKPRLECLIASETARLAALVGSLPWS